MTRKLSLAIMMLAVVALVVLFATSGEPPAPFLHGTALAAWLTGLGYPNVIAFNLAVGYLVSAFFWVLVVYLPERSRRNVLRLNFGRSYQQFKEATTRILLWASIGAHDSELTEELCDPVKFKAFFGANKSEHWYAALNGLEGEPARMSELILELEIFADEVGYVLNAVAIQDANVHRILKSLKEHVYRLNHSTVYTGDQVKYVGQFLWEVLAHWDFIEGYRERDYIQDAIDSLAR
jgi:hypothetical protein